MRILVCGDRAWSDRASIHAHLQAVKDSLPSREPITIIHGACRGADQLAGEVASELGMQVMVFPAEWNRLGRTAGPVRNTQMLKEGKPDCALAFHPNLALSKGTKNMVNQLIKAGIPYLVFTK